MIDTEHDLAGCRRSHARLLDHLAHLTDEDAAAASLLPGWTVAMLVTHLARNADSHRGMFEGAAVGEPRQQYPSAEARDADIALYAYTHVAEDGGFDLAAYPAIGAWLKRVAERPGHVTMDWRPEA